MEERIQKLEKQLKGLRYLSLGLLLVVFLGGPVLWNSQPRKEITVKRLVVVGNNGAPSIILTANQDGAGKITTYNASGNPLVNLGIKEDGSGTVETTNGEDSVMAWIGSEEDSGFVVTFNTAKERLVQIYKDKDGTGAISIENKDSNK